MKYKIEVAYTYGWDDAGWSEETDGVTRPLRFGSVGCAHTALDKFFANVKAAVAAGNMDAEKNHNQYRIVTVT